jgi:hypothetical protein
VVFIDCHVCVYAKACVCDRQTKTARRVSMYTIGRYSIYIEDIGKDVVVGMRTCES